MYLHNRSLQLPSSSWCLIGQCYIAFLFLESFSQFEMCVFFCKNPCNVGKLSQQSLFGLSVLKGSAHLATVEQCHPQTKWVEKSLGKTSAQTCKMIAILQVFYVITYTKYLAWALCPLQRHWAWNALCTSCAGISPATDCTLPVLASPNQHVDMFPLLSAALGATGCASWVSGTGDPWKAWYLPNRSVFNEITSFSFNISVCLLL